MVKEAKTKIYKTNSRHYIYLPKALVTDSLFPLDISKPVKAKIEKDKLIIQQI